MHITRPTKILRATLTQEARVVLPECETRERRKVQILVPEGSEVYAGLDATPEQIGPNRVYKLPQIPTGETIVFRLLPEQYLVAGAGEGLAFCTLIVEYYKDN